jgi:hypothetical protein
MLLRVKFRELHDTSLDICFSTNPNGEVMSVVTDTCERHSHASLLQIEWVGRTLLILTTLT